MNPPSSPDLASAAPSESRSPEEPPIVLRWSVSTLAGWAGLVLGTVAAIVIVIVAVTQ